MIITHIGLRIAKNVYDHRIEQKKWNKLKNEYSDFSKEISVKKYKIFHHENIIFRFDISGDGTNRPYECYYEHMTDIKISANLSYTKNIINIDELFKPIDFYYDIYESHIHSVQIDEFNTLVFEQKKFDNEEIFEIYIETGVLTNVETNVPTKTVDLLVQKITKFLVE